METKLEQIEKLFKKADFSKETDLKLNLGRKLFPVREVPLNELMEQEGMKTHVGEKNSHARQRSASLEAQKGRKKDPDSLGAIERENPLIKKNKPPLL